MATIKKGINSTQNKNQSNINTISLVNALNTMLENKFQETFNFTTNDFINYIYQSQAVSTIDVWNLKSIYMNTKTFYNLFYYDEEILKLLERIRDNYSKLTSNEEVNLFMILRNFNSISLELMNIYNRYGRDGYYGSGFYSGNDINAFCQSLINDDKKKKITIEEDLKVRFNRLSTYGEDNPFAQYLLSLPLSQEAVDKLIFDEHISPTLFRHESISNNAIIKIMIEPNPKMYEMWSYDIPNSIMLLLKYRSKNNMLSKEERRTLLENNKRFSYCIDILEPFTDEEKYILINKGIYSTSWKMDHNMKKALITAEPELFLELNSKDAELEKIFVKKLPEVVKASHRILYKLPKKYFTKELVDLAYDSWLKENKSNSEKCFLDVIFNIDGWREKTSQTLKQFSMHLVEKEINRFLVNNESYKHICPELFKNIHSYLNEKQLAKYFVFNSVNSNEDFDLNVKDFVNLKIQLSFKTLVKILKDLDTSQEKPYSITNCEMFKKFFKLSKKLPLDLNELTSAERTYLTDNSYLEQIFKVYKDNLLESSLSNVERFKLGLTLDDEYLKITPISFIMRYFFKSPKSERFNQCMSIMNTMQKTRFVKDIVRSNPEVISNITQTDKVVKLILEVFKENTYLANNYVGCLKPFYNEENLTTLFTLGLKGNALNLFIRKLNYKNIPETSLLCLELAYNVRHIISIEDINDD